MEDQLLEETNNSVYCRHCTREIADDNYANCIICKQFYHYECIRGNFPNDYVDYAELLQPELVEARRLYDEQTRLKQSTRESLMASLVNSKLAQDEISREIREFKNSINRPITISNINCPINDTNNEPAQLYQYDQRMNTHTSMNAPHSNLTYSQVLQSNLSRQSKKLSNFKTSSQNPTTQLPSILMYSHNISGGKSKLMNINSRLATTMFDVICLQETWYDATVQNYELNGNSDFNIFRMDGANFKTKSTRGGGVVTLVKNSLNTIKIDYLVSTTIEFVMVEITLNTDKLVII